MASVTFKNIQKTYQGGVHIIKGVDLDIADGEFMVFVGPSGCGKSTMMRMIAGLEDITAGELRIGDRLANDLPPVARKVAMVFQSYALYPHMTVEENMGFGLRINGTKREETKAIVGRVAEILQISHLLDRKPKALSGGQRQRVAIGRAIVRKPEVFLFDEPLSNLDAGLRVQMRVELANLHRELGTTMIYVTHDQTEAMTLGDRIAVFNAGRIEQVGRPMDLYQRPANAFVAGFLGSPKMNLIPCEAAPGPSGAVVRVAGQTPLDWPGRRLPADSASGQAMLLGIRPEAIACATEGPGLNATLVLVERLGDVAVLHAQVPGLEEMVCLKVPEGGAHLEAGRRIVLQLDFASCHLFDKAGMAV